MKFVDNRLKISRAQLDRFLSICWTKYMKARIEPGLSSFLYFISLYLPDFFFLYKKKNNELT